MTDTHHAPHPVALHANIQWCLGDDDEATVHVADGHLFIRMDAIGGRGTLTISGSPEQVATLGRDLINHALDAGARHQAIRHTDPMADPTIDGKRLSVYAVEHVAEHPAELPADPTGVDCAERYESHHDA